MALLIFILSICFSTNEISIDSNFNLFSGYIWNYLYTWMFLIYSTAVFSNVFSYINKKFIKCFSHLILIIYNSNTHICVIRYTSHNFNDNCLGNLTLLTETEKKYTANITWGTHRISKELHYSFSYPISSWPCIVTTVVRINIRSLAGSFSAFHQD